MWWFCFQAEDGIRDLVRSRGLGDVYKRQLPTALGDDLKALFFGMNARSLFIRVDGRAPWTTPVSYTHLTLPTSDLV